MMGFFIFLLQYIIHIIPIDKKVKAYLILGEFFLRKYMLYYALICVAVGCIAHFTYSIAVGEILVYIGIFIIVMQSILYIFGLAESNMIYDYEENM